MIWHPFTPQLGSDAPLKLVRGEREYLFDAAGKRYVDAVASWWTMVHGHNHPEIIAAITRQLQTLDHAMLAGFTHEPAERLAAKLLALNDNQFSHVFYSDNGSTAVEIMLKLALQYWYNLGEVQRNIFVKFDAAYHGDTVGAMSVAGDSLFNRPFRNLLFQAHEFAYPTEGESAEAILVALESYLAEHARVVVGIVIEPLIAAAGGMVFQTTETLKRIAALAKKYNVLLLCDEVFTGLGRTGALFAWQKAQVMPDIVALAKGLTGGVLPLAATLTTKKIHAAFASDDPAKTFYHGHTMTGNPPGCAAALASLDLLMRPGTLENIKALEEKMRTRWQTIATRYGDKISNVRALGAVSVANLVTHSEKPGYVFSAVNAIKRQALAEGVILRPLGNVIYVTPPYNISDAALDITFAAIEKIVKHHEPA